MTADRAGRVPESRGYLALSALALGLLLAGCSGRGELQPPDVEPGSVDAGAQSPEDAGPTKDEDAGSPLDSGTPDAGPGDAGTLDEPTQLVGLHFWDQSGTDAMGAPKFFVVEAYPSDLSPDLAAAFTEDREKGNARVILRIDYQWGSSVPKTAAERDTYAQRLVAIARAIQARGLKSHHYVLGNESNLPWEGAATPEQVGLAYQHVHAALAAAGPWARQPLLLTTPPSTAAAYGGGDGSYLRAILQSIQAKGTLVDGIALHAYENGVGSPPQPGSADLFMHTVNYQAQVLKELGLARKPIFITEANVQLGGNEGGGDDVGASFVTNGYRRLDAWNKGGEGNPSPSELRIATACWFVWSDVGGAWGNYAIPKWPKTLVAFRAAASAGYRSAYPP